MIHERLVLRAVIETKVADIIVMIVGRDRMIAMIDDLDRKKDAMVVMVVVVVGAVETIINTVDAIVVVVIMMIIVVTKWKKEEQIEKLPSKNK